MKIDLVMLFYVLLATISNELAKDEMKKKRIFMFLTLIYGACESVWHDNCEILFIVSVIVMCLNIYWEEGKEKYEKNF